MGKFKGSYPVRVMVRFRVSFRVQKHVMRGTWQHPKSLLSLNALTPRSAEMELNFSKGPFINYVHQFGRFSDPPSKSTFVQNSKPPPPYFGRPLEISKIDLTNFAQLAFRDLNLPKHLFSMFLGSLELLFYGNIIFRSTFYQFHSVVSEIQQLKYMDVAFHKKPSPHRPLKSQNQKPPPLLIWWT